MKKIVTVIGARPQIIKSAAISRVIKEQFSGRIEEVLIHTGQHYDDNLSAVFFKELGLELPAYNLGIGSCPQGKQTALMMTALEDVFIKEKPDVVLVYGDTNSTLATALIAAKLHYPIAHVEAGLRSFNKSMPEEINRIMCDHCSTFLFSPTLAGIENLQREGITNSLKFSASADHPRVYHCGDIMYDNSCFYGRQASEYLPKEVMGKNFFLATVHRPTNTDNIDNLNTIFNTFLKVLDNYPSHHLVLPFHPRAQKNIVHLSLLYDKITSHPRIIILPPVSYLEMIALEKKCDMVITDSGGVQKEAYFHKKPCVILRDETEWVEIVEQKTGVLVGAVESQILMGVSALMKKRNNLVFPSLFGDGNAANWIVDKIFKNC